VSHLSSEARVRNPYYHLTMIREPDLFFGRLNTLRRLYSAIYDQQCLSLVGPRRIGKSSILGMLRSEVVQKRFGYDLTTSIVTFIDTAEHPQKSVETFLHFTCEQLVAQSQGRIPPEILPLPGIDSFRAFLDLIKAMGFHPVLLLDEFESITGAARFDQNFFAFLRAQANSGRISYITASRDSLDKVSHPEILGSPFFNIFSTHKLGPFTQEEAEALITIPSSLAGYTFTPDEVAWVLKVAGNHPFFIHRACYFLFEEKALAQGASVDLTILEKQTYEELLPHFEYSWNHLDAQQQELVAWEARRDEAFQRKHPELSESLLFRNFVRAEHSLNLASLTVADIDEILKNLDNVRFLGESKISYLNITYLEIRDSNSSLVERGAAVKKLVLAAIEKLRPESSVKKLEGKWRHYNILNWSRHKLKVEEIAARLSISVRQYHRDRDVAVEALLNVLLEMEVTSKVIF